MSGRDRRGAMTLSSRGEQPGMGSGTPALGVGEEVLGRSCARPGRVPRCGRRRAGSARSARALVCAPVPACLEASATAWPAWGHRCGHQPAAATTAHVQHAPHLTCLICHELAVFGNPRVWPGRWYAPERTPLSATHAHTQGGGGGGMAEPYRSSEVIVRRPKSTRQSSL